jgi:hypothetical protein
MTLVAAWIRQLKEIDQLVVASDSRLSFGARWDCCPKIVPLLREDSVLAFCGDTAFAYPILLQLTNAVRNYGKAASREMDISDLRPHFLKVIESMRGQVKDIPHGPHGIDTTDFKLLFAGYSHRTKIFKAWCLYFHRKAGKFAFRSIFFHRKRTGGTKPFVFMGDNTSEAARLLYRKLEMDGKLRAGGLDMEPLEVLVEMIESEEFGSIGGPPQIVKVYPFASVLPINVLWPRARPEFVAHFGRPLLNYEGSRYACFDLRDYSLLSPADANVRLNDSLYNR